MTTPTTPATSHADYRRAAALAHHYLHGDEDGVAVVLAEAEQAGRLVQLVTVLLTVMRGTGWPADPDVEAKLTALIAHAAEAEAREDER